MSEKTFNCAKHDNFGITIERYNFSGIRITDKSDNSIDCYYSEIRRKDNKDEAIDYTPPLPIRVNDVTYFASNVSTVNVTCFLDKTHNESYSKVIALIPDLNINENTNLPKNLPNLLFIGIDSLSRVNFERHYPKTIPLLAKHKFYTLYGYNKVADNTFPNLTPLLTGQYLDDLWNEGMAKTTFLDFFPLVFKEYRNKSYNTLLIEDYPRLATFNFFRLGFREPPTNYYLRPFSLAIEDNIENNCYLDKPEIEVYYDYVYDFVKAMTVRKQRYFAFTFMARLTHDLLNNAGLADPLVYRLFSKLFDENLLSNTILIFFSDHGIRFGKIRETLSGKWEERMPLMQVYVPDTWKSDNWTLNKHRLITPFDIHATLKHIINGQPDNSLKHGKSLLWEIPENRTCSSIPVLEHWCSCQSSDPITNLSSIEPLAQFVVESVNKYLSQNFSNNCIELTLDRVISGYAIKFSEKVMQFKDSLNDVNNRHVVFNDEKFVENSRNILVTVSVKPSDALFEATVNVNQNKDNMTLIGEISRINKYGDQSNCIDNTQAKRYCFCKNHLH
ncbi:uncharacterized protein LOC128955765 [Oppia nitens]|uniref:uncharacterized protein LOC128955765 n=1 Tax=Oppia nitens TaxID=1686743 RepID=UPI0023D9EF06|nr:uncharacterized protein LOC128955765 [Oppia nitens]